MTTSGTARGKVILLGEHAVVYGVPALVAALDKGARAEASLAPSDRVWLGDSEAPADDPLHQALLAARAPFGLSEVELRLDLDLPAGSGLGASAALGVATARALAALAERSDPELLERATLAWERVFHGNPSGVDAAAAARGGILRYVRGEVPLALQVARPFEISICVAGPPAPTAEMVESVARLRASRPEAFEKNLAAIASLVASAAAALRLGDLENLGRLMDLNHMLLSSWMLSTSELEIARELARGAGAFGSKLTGSGGGGAVIALGPQEHILRAWREHGLPCFGATLGA